MVSQVIFNARIHGAGERVKHLPPDSSFILPPTSTWRSDLLSRSVMTHWSSWRLADISRLNMPYRPDVTEPVMRTPAAPANPHHSTNFGSIHHPKSDLASPLDPTWCDSKIPVSLPTNPPKVRHEPNNNGCELPHWAWGTHVGFVMDGSPCTHCIL